MELMTAGLVALGSFVGFGLGLFVGLWFGLSLGHCTGRLRWDQRTTGSTFHECDERIMSGGKY